MSAALLRSDGRRSCRLCLTQGREAAFEKRWAERKSRLGLLTGFRFFSLLRRVDVTKTQVPGWTPFECSPAARAIDPSFELKARKTRSRRLPHLGSRAWEVVGRRGCCGPMSRRSCPTGQHGPEQWRL